ncbi:MAG: DUF4270 family protein [Muribaculaceae bacterium]
MRLTSIIPLAFILALAAAPACQDDDNTIGSTIVQDDVTITVDSAFTLSGYTIANPNVRSSTVSQLIGRIDADAFGTISSDFVTQFMPASRFDTTDVTVNDIDSLLLVMSVVKGDFVGDSIVPMGLTIYPLTKLLPSPIYSDFNPEGYYDPTPLASSIYNLSTASADTVVSYNYRQIRVKMPLELGRKFFSEYKRDPAQFSSPDAFAKIFPGLYIKNSYGSGRISTISSTMMSLYFHKTVKITDSSTGEERDSIIGAVGNYFAVTPEIITNNNISLSVSPSMQRRVDEGQHILMAPTGYDVRVRFPAPELIAKFNENKNFLKVVNTLYFTLPGEKIANEDGIEPPTTVLLIPESKREEYFAGNDLPDGITEFYATWSTSDNAYVFSDMSKYLVYLLEKDTITEEDYTFVITPVSRVEEVTDEYYGTTSLVSLNPYMGNPAMVRLLLDKAKIKLTFTSQYVGAEL